MKNRNILYLIFALFIFFANSLYAVETSKQAKDDPMKVIESGKGWSKLEVIDQKALESDPRRSRGEKLLPGQNQLYVIHSMEGAKNAPLPEDEREELISELKSSRDGGITIYHAGVIDAIKLGKLDIYKKYFETDISARGWGCRQWHYRTKSYSGNLNDLSESIDIYNSSNDNYSVDVNLDVSGAVVSEFAAGITYMYKKTRWWQGCFPYKFRFVGSTLKGDMNVDDLSVILEGTFQANLINKSWEIAEIEIADQWFFIGPIPVRIGVDLPIAATLAADITIAGEVGVQSHGTGRVKFDKVCNSNFVCADQTPFVNDWDSVIDSTELVVGLDAKLNARAGLSVALEPYLYSKWALSANVGVNAGVDGMLWGYIGNSCGNADSVGGNEWVSALTADLDFSLVGIGTWRWLGNNETIGSLHGNVFYETHIGFFDLLPGGSSALEPMLNGSSNQGSSANYTARMRPCVPFTDTVNYAVNWDDGVSQNFSSAPTTNHSLSHTWYAPGPYDVELTALSDAHGRVFNATTTRSIDTNVTPVPSFTVSCNALECSFDASNSYDSDGAIENYEWSFGQTGVTTTKTYTVPGLYFVTLTVTDNEGASRSSSRSFYAQAINIALSGSINGNLVHWSSNDPNITSVDIYRDDVIIGNDSSGTYLDAESSPFEQHIYKVCKTGSTTLCATKRRRGLIFAPVLTDDEAGNPSNSDDSTGPGVILP